MELTSHDSREDKDVQAGMELTPCNSREEKAGMEFTPNISREEKASMEFIPHEYQEYAIQFVLDHPEAMLLLDMGLGKTSVGLFSILQLMFDRFEVSKVLITAPLRVCNTVWPAEREKWTGLDFLKMSVMTGPAKERIAALQTNADVYVINRENVKWLIDYLTRNRIPWPFDMVVIDELSSFKNHTSQRWKALRRVRPLVKRILGLTGTPAGNGLMDLWAETFLIDNGKRLGRFIGRYREAFFKPASMNPLTGVVYSYELRPGAEEAIYSRISDISVSMSACDYLEMPECLFVNHFVAMDPAERELYDTLKSDFIVEVGDDIIDASNAAVLSGKLRQLANGAIYNETGDVRILHNRKLQMLEDLAEQANGQAILIAYWFRHDLMRIREYLTAAGYAPRLIHDDKDIADWNAGKIQIGLLSPQSLGHGVNLQQCPTGHTLIWFGPIWSLELYQQTNARLYRQGQKEVVTIHHIICKDTVDEDVIKALEEKNTTQQALINAVKARL